MLDGQVFPLGAASPATDMVQAINTSTPIIVQYRTPPVSPPGVPPSHTLAPGPVLGLPSSGTPGTARRVGRLAVVEVEEPADALAADDLSGPAFIYRNFATHRRTES